MIRIINSLILAVITFFVFPLFARADYPITECGDLTYADTTYVLMNDITVAPGESCFRFNWGENKVLDLNGHTISFDAQDLDEILNPSFEAAGASSSLAANWDFSHAPSASRVNNQRFWRFGEDYTIVFPANSSASVSNPQYIESNNMNLPAGNYRAQYLFYSSLSSNEHMFLQVTSNGTPLSCSVTGLNRPAPESHWWYYSCDFTLTSSSNTKMRLGLDGVPDNETIIDMAELRPIGTSIISSVTGTSGLIIKNGSIVQGDAAGFGGFVIRLFPSASDDDSRVKIQDLNITVRGSGTVPVSLTNANGAVISGNVINVNGTYYKDRYLLMPSIEVIDSDSVQIYANEIYEAYQTGIKVNRCNDANIYGNTISMDSKLTDGYAIDIRGSDDVYIYNNNLSGNGRGIHLAGENNAEVFDNLINMKEFVNPEYPDAFSLSAQGLCAHGIRVEGMDNVYLHDNVITMIADQNTFVACPLAISQANNLAAEQNRLYAHTSYYSPSTFFTSASLFLLGTEEGHNSVIRNNEFISNEAAIYAMNTYEINLDSNIIFNAGASASEFNAVHVGGFPANTLGGLDLFDTTIENAVLDNPAISWAGSSDWNYSVSWKLRVDVKNSQGEPLPGAYILIKDSSFQTVFSGTIDNTGLLDLRLKEYDIVGSSNFNYSKIQSSPYTVDVSYEGETISRSIDLNQSKTEVFEMGLVPSDTIPPLMFNGSPTGTLPYSTTQTIVALNTDETATCRYSNIPGLSYSEMPNSFMLTDGVIHASMITGLSSGRTYSFYVKCADSSGNVNNSDYLINFYVARRPIINPKYKELSIDSAVSNDVAY